MTGVTPGCVDWNGRLDQEDGDHNSDQRADGVEQCIDERAEAPRHARLVPLQREAEPQRQQEGDAQAQTCRLDARQRPDPQECEQAVHDDVKDLLGGRGRAGIQPREQVVVGARDARGNRQADDQSGESEGERPPVSCCSCRQGIQCQAVRAQLRRSRLATVLRWMVIKSASGQWNMIRGVWYWFRDGIAWSSPAVRRLILHSYVTTIFVVAVLANAVLSCDYIGLVVPTLSRCDLVHSASATRVTPP